MTGLVTAGQLQHHSAIRQIMAKGALLAVLTAVCLPAHADGPTPAQTNTMAADAFTVILWIPPRQKP
jgi:hypothetical protein